MKLHLKFCFNGSDNIVNQKQICIKNYFIHYIMQIRLKYTFFSLKRLPIKLIRQV